MILLLLATVASMILSFVPINEACGHSAGCSIVQASQYESTFGFKNAHLGLVAFATLFIITLLHDKKPTKKTKQIVLAGLVLGSLVALYFLYLQFFVLHAICKYCMIADFGIILSLIIFFIFKDKPKNSKKK